MPIESFSHKGLRRLFERGDVRGVPAELVEKLNRMLTVIDTALVVEEVDVFPGWRLHPLKGDLEGYWSITVTGNRRLIFRFEDGGAFDLDLVDYH